MALSISSTMTSTSCEVETILPGWTFFLVQDISETWTRPSTPGFQLDERTVIGDVRHAAGVDRVERVLGSFHGVPRIVLQLLHAEGDTVGFLVDLDDLDLDGLADRQDLGRVVHTAPGHVGDVQQAVDAAEVNECTVFGDVLDDTVHRIAFGQLADNLGALFGTAFFQDGAARDNDVATATVHFQDLERLLETHQRAGIAHGAHIDLASRAGRPRHRRDRR